MDNHVANVLTVAFGLVPPLWAVTRAINALGRRLRPFQFGLAELLLVSLLLPLATMAFLYSGYPLVVVALVVYQAAFAFWMWTRDTPGEISTVLLLLAGILLGSMVFFLWIWFLVFMVMILPVGVPHHRK